MLDGFGGHGRSNHSRLALILSGGVAHDEGELHVADGLAARRVLPRRVLHGELHQRRRRVLLVHIADVALALEHGADIRQSVGHARSLAVWSHSPWPASRG